MNQLAALVVGVALCLGLAGSAPGPKARFDTGDMPAPLMRFPAGPAGGVVFLMSGASGWTAADGRLADALLARRAIVVGIDLPSYLARLAASERSCAYTVSAIESLNRQLQRAAGLADFRPPLVVGRGLGATLALAIASQSPNATIGRTLAFDPEAALPLEKPLCTPAARRRTAGGTIYDLKTGPLPNPVEIHLTAAAPQDGRAQALRLKAAQPALRLQEAGSADPLPVLDAALKESERQAHALPLIVTATPPRLDTMAVILSGDGGWRDIDKKVAGFLEADGIPTVGFDALRYFWSERSPEETARDLEGAIRLYRARFGVRHVVMIGYSFGANVLPKTLAALSPELRRDIPLAVLLAPSPQADFRISVFGWLGAAGSGAGGSVAEAVRTLDPALFLCVHGAAEKESACPALAGSGAEIDTRKGGHHFDGDYRSLTDRIVTALRARLARR